MVWLVTELQAAAAATGTDGCRPVLALTSRACLCFHSSLYVLNIRHDLKPCGITSLSLQARPSVAGDPQGNSGLGGPTGQLVSL